MELMEIAESALCAYGMDKAVPTLLRHNENAVFRVDMPDGNQYVLRLHIPVQGVSAAHREDWLHSEMVFIDALYTSGCITVQRPIRAEDGQWAVFLPAYKGWATLLSWLPGEPLDQSDIGAAEYARLTGELAAQLHEFAAAWPEGYRLLRPAYDARRVTDAVGALRRGVDMGLFDARMYGELMEGACSICERMDVENARPGAHGLIHSDLGLGNLIVYNGCVSPIDFGLCGHGPFLFDLGGLMGAFDYAALRSAALEGYSQKRPLSEDDSRSTEAFFVAGIYFFMAMHLNNSGMHEWFGRRLPHVISDYVRPLIDGAPFLHTLLA